MKKIYVKPQMKVVKMRHRTRLLTGSQFYSTKTNMSEDEDLDYVGGGSYQGR